MVVMALDHVRDFLSGGGLDPRDVAHPALYMTRWVTHFCAPVFMFLSGSSAFLYGRRGKTTREVHRFLLTRGLWLVVLELTIVRFGWTYSLDYQVIPAQVIWAIGWSMVVLSLLVFLPRWVVAAFALTMIAGHNALDGVRAEGLGALAPLWVVLHQGGPLRVTAGTTVLIVYAAARRRRLVGVGLGACVAFVVLRALDRYGDPRPWVPQDGALATVLSFVNCEKYPPSLLFLLMTLGPAIALLPALERARGSVARALVTIGRVPLMYYVVHLLVIHALAVVVAQVFFGDGTWLLGGRSFLTKPPGYGVGLPVIYALWLAVVVSLFPLCRWFAAVKQRRRDWWLSYL